MSGARSKTQAGKSSATKKPTSSGASVRDVVAQVTHIQEVTAIVRSAASEIANRFSGLGSALPELLLQRDGCGARPATVEAIVAAESSLNALASNLEGQALLLLSLPTEGAQAEGTSLPVPGFGIDNVVRRDLLELSNRPPKPPNRPG